jgi:hypothetical protein
LSVIQCSLIAIPAAKELKEIVHIEIKYLAPITVLCALLATWLLGIVLDVSGFNRAYQTEQNERNEMLKQIKQSK